MDMHALGQDRQTRVSWRIEHVIWIGYLKHGLNNAASHQSSNGKEMTMPLMLRTFYVTK